MKKVKLKSGKDLKKHIDLTSDSGEMIRLRVKKSEGVSIYRNFHSGDFGKEYLVVDHPNPISKDEYELIKELFEDKKDKSSYNGVF
jgi:hypothetical protein